MISRGPRWGFWLAAVLLSGACASDPALMDYDRQMVAAEKRVWQGDFEGAHADFARLRDVARDDSDAIRAELRRVETLRRMDRLVEAEAAAGALFRSARENGDRELRGKIVLARARIVLQMAGQEVRGTTMLRQVVERFPDTAAGARAFLLVRGRLAEADPAGFAEYCEERFRSDPKGELADTFAYEAGRVYFERGTVEGDRSAERAYRLVLEGWTLRTSGVWDDAIWDLSLIAHRRGEFLTEIGLLEHFLEQRVVATPPGSYEHGNYKQAWLRIVGLYLDELADVGKAITWLEEFPEEFPLARARGEALYLLAGALDRVGEPARATAVRTELLEKFPDSKWARRLRRSAGTL